MWMNLDVLPADQAMYTAFVGQAGQDFDSADPNDVAYDEYSFVAHVNLTRDGAARRASEVDDASQYDLGGADELLGVADQSNGYWVYLSENGRKLLR